MKGRENLQHLQITSDVGGCLALVIKMATSNGNYELKKNHSYLLNFLLPCTTIENLKCVENK
jgi:hypothetical protein